MRSQTLSFCSGVMNTHSATSATVASRIEGQVGQDLQFIRINGTLVGGLVGLMLHAFSLLLVK